MKFHPGAGIMNSGSSRYRSALIREDAYFSEIDQILLANLRETLALCEEAEKCAAGARNEHPATSHVENEQFAFAN